MCVILLFLILGNILAASSSCPESPAITLEDHYPETNYTFLSIGKSPTLYFPGKVFVILRCRSRQPVYWSYNNPQLQQFRFIRPRRTSSDPLNSTTFCFTVDLFLYSMQASTGTYSCRALASEDVTSLSVFVDEQRGSPFVVSQMRPLVQTPQVQDGWLLIPCKVRKPLFRVKLIRRSNNESEEVGRDLLRWDPAVGFKVNTTLLPAYEGKYTCVTAFENKTHEASLEVKYEGKEPRPSVSISLAPGQVVCSTEGNATLRHLVYKTCNNLMECWNVEKRQTSLVDRAMNGTPGAQQLYVKTPSVSNEHEFQFLGGVAQCIAVIVDTKSDHTSVPFVTTAYQFASLSSGNAMVILQENEVNETLLTSNGIPVVKHTIVRIASDLASERYYVGETHTFDCEVSRFPAAEGIEWVFGMDDGSQVGRAQVNISETHGFDRRRPSDRGYTLWSTLSVRLWSSGIRNISCKAPMWSNYDWLVGTVELNVSDSTKPKVIHPVGETKYIAITITANEKLTLNCSATGEPTAVIRWKKIGNNSLKGTEQNDSVSEGQTHSSITFPVVTKSTEGVYLCNASNAGGWDSRRFDVKVLANNALLVGTITGAIIAVAILLGLVAFLYKYIIHQRKIIGQILSEKELQEFFYGNMEMIKGKDCDSPEYSQFMPFKKEYEIPPTNVEIDSELLLGSGQYGMVYKGVLAISQQPRDVAIKTVKPAADKDYIKALLQEIKIMMTVGGHPNIVNFHGAVTEDLRAGKVLVVLEFCAFGSLEIFLQNHRQDFVNLVLEDGTIHQPSQERRVSLSHSQTNNTLKLDTWNLIRWAHEVAAGMEYLASKKVIHADLACRNVLLTEDMVAKITDFGLSRQLYQNAEYVKKTMVPLPWRHMAIESLKDMNFSAASDVWSYGVTLWEIFSLGAVPFPGYLWDIDFLKKLEAGFRMDKPDYATNDIYEVMVKCWAVDPAARPSFTHLKNYFYSIIRTLEPNTGDYYKLDECKI